MDNAKINSIRKLTSIWWKFGRNRRSFQLAYSGFDHSSFYFSSISAALSFTISSIRARNTIHEIAFNATNLTYNLLAQFAPNPRQWNKNRFKMLFMALRNVCPRNRHLLSSRCFLAYRHLCITIAFSVNYWDAQPNLSRCHSQSIQTNISRFKIPQKP